MGDFTQCEKLVMCVVVESKTLMFATPHFIAEVHRPHGDNYF